MVRDNHALFPGSRPSIYSTSTCERGTHMNPRFRGMSTAGIIGAIAVVAVIGFAIAYFGSDVFRTKANTTLTQFTQWTPENIAKDPINYLNFCEEQAKKSLEKCKAGQIAIAKKQGEIESMLKGAKDKSTLGAKALSELKTLYTSAEEGASFPIKWNNIEMDKEAAKRQIMKFARETKSATELSSKLGAAKDQLKTQANKLAEAKDEAHDQLAKISTNREMLKVQQITDDLKDNLVAMKSAIQSTVVDISSAEPGSLSLDDLARQSESVIDDSEFNKIMSDK